MRRQACSQVVGSLTRVLDAVSEIALNLHGLAIALFGLGSATTPVSNDQGQELYPSLFPGIGIGLPVSVPAMNP